MKKSLLRAITLVLALAPMLVAWGPPPSPPCGVYPCYRLFLDRCSIACQSAAVKIEMSATGYSTPPMYDVWNPTRFAKTFCLPTKLRGRFDSIITISCAASSKQYRFYQPLLWSCDGRPDGSQVTVNISLCN